MIQDKEEIIFKRVKSEGGDKEGLREAELRRKLTNIMSNYGLREHFEDSSMGRQKQDPVSSAHSYTMIGNTQTSITHSITCMMHQTTKYR